MHVSSQCHVAASNLSSSCNISPSGFAARRQALDRRTRVMEVAAIMMLAAVVLGICLQFDRQV
jgi:hypothetical protein